MAYAFESTDHDLKASLRRIVDEELGAAIARLDQLDEAEAVHSIRKNLKKTRAILRLVRAGLAEQPAINRNLREVGLALSARRDAQVRLATLHRLFPEPAPELLPLQTQLAAECPAPAADPPRRLQDALSALRKGSRSWSLRGKDDRILRHGLAITRLQARRATDTARENPAAVEAIHDWRKRAKDLWYQARLFAPCWPEIFKPIVAGADQLGEILGDHHDLSVLAAFAATQPDAIMPGAARRMLDDRLRDAQAGIEAAAFPLSARLFAGNPEGVAALWVDWRRISGGRIA